MAVVVVMKGTSTVPVVTTSSAPPSAGPGARATPEAPTHVAPSLNGFQFISLHSKRNKLKIIK
jgi:hypothetical protein